MKHSTMKDVAEHANVSIATVSRVLNQSKPVSKKIETSVREAIVTLNYKVNPAARTLSTEKSGIIGLLIDQIPDVTFYSLVQHIEQEALNQEYVTLLGITNGDSEKEKIYWNKLYNHRIEGVIVLTAFLYQEYEQRLMNTHIPILYCEASSSKKNHHRFISRVRQFLFQLL